MLWALTLYGRVLVVSLSVSEAKLEHLTWTAKINVCVKFQSLNVRRLGVTALVTYCLHIKQHIDLIMKSFFFCHLKNYTNKRKTQRSMFTNQTRLCVLCFSCGEGGHCGSLTVSMADDAFTHRAE